jgi:uncharacterized protein
MQAPPDSILARILRRLAGWVYSYPRLFFYPQILLLVFSVIYTVTNLEFSLDRNELVGADKEYHRNFLTFLEEFEAQEDLVALVESDQPEKNRQFIERLAARLEAEPHLFTDVFYKGDLKLMGPKALLFMEEETLRELKETLIEYQPFLEQFTQAENLTSLFRQINEQFRASRRAEAESLDSLVQVLPALQRILEQARDSLDRPGMPPSPGVTALFNAGPEAEQEQYLTFANGRIYLVTARALDHDLNRVAVERLRQLVRETEAEVPGVNVGITGEPVLEMDEMAQAQRDMALASVISLTLVALIFVVAYRETGRPLKAMMALVVGLGYTLGYTTLAVGHLNILTVTFLPILVGLAIDFGIHLVTRYEEELQLGASEKDAMERAMVNTGSGIFTGCFTTAGAFFAMSLTDFRGIQEMGIITGGGILICLIPMMTFLPVLLLQGRQNVLDHEKAAADRRARLEKRWLERPVLVTALGGILLLLALTQFTKVRFDYNLLNMQSQTLASVVFERKLIHTASKSVLFGAVIADTPEQAVRLEEKLLRQPAVGSVDSISRFLVEDPSRKLQKIREIKEALAPVQFPQLKFQNSDLDPLRQTLFYTASYLGLARTMLEKSGALEQAEEVLLKQLIDLREAIVDLRHGLSRGNPEQHSERLGAFEYVFFRDVQETFEALKNQDASAGLTIDDFPSAIRNRFIGRSGRHLLQVYPEHDIWERSHQEEFVRQLRETARAFDGQVTGTPVQLYEYTTLLKQSYETAALYALGAIALLIFIHFRTLSGVALALLPVAVGTGWTLGLMGFLDIPFNPANIMTLPLVIGIGVTNGIHILNRFMEEKNPGILAKSTGKAVLVSGLTTIVGFGSLMTAQHQGIASLGIVMSMGAGLCMIAALTCLPAVLNLFSGRGRLIQKKPSGDRNVSTGSGGTEVNTSMIQGQ